MTVFAYSRHFSIYRPLQRIIEPADSHRIGPNQPLSSQTLDLAMVSGFNMPSMACATSARPNQEREMQHVFTVQGMTCGHCERAVTQAVQGVDDQAQVKIDRAAQRVEVDSSASREALGAAIAEEGYKVA
jgi:copper chaperone